jgi:hypothetical protein
MARGDALAKCKLSVLFGVDESWCRVHHPAMLNSDDHRALAERCVRLAQECSKPRVAEYLMALAANYLELAEFPSGERRLPATVITLDQRRKSRG